MSQIRTSPLLIFLALAGCSGGVIGSTEDESHSPEVTVTGDALRTKFENIDSWYISPPLELGEKATRVAAMWTALSMERPLAVQARGIDAAGTAGKWRSLEQVFSEEELGVARIDLDGEYSRVQIRVPEGDAKLVGLLTFTGSRPDIIDDSQDISQTTLGLAADLSAAGILPRSAWGARNARCGNNDRAKERMAIHHTASARTAGGSYEGLLRQTQAYHMDGRGYCDVGYHFFVTADGRVWEARNVDHVGGHSGNYNGGNIGMVFVGCFDSSGACNNLGGRDVPEAMMAGAARAISALTSRYSIPINSDRIKGHGQQPYQQTACPGDSMRNRLEELRERARGSNPPPQQPPQQPSNPPSGPTRSCGGLNNNETLSRGTEMRSCNGLYLLAHQADGNVVLYNTYSGAAVWHLGTNGRSTSSFTMQGDGNLVLYSPNGTALWASGTRANGATLAVQDDGNVVIYSGSRALWSTNTVGAGGTPPPQQPPPQQPPQQPPPQQPANCGILGSNGALGEDQATPACGGRYSFVHQSDGNVVLYNGSRAIWSTGTHGRNTSSLVMQGDGNLVLYSANGNALWSTGTHGNNGAFLGVQDDGNVVVYTANGRPLWSTNTVGR